MRLSFNESLMCLLFFEDALDRWLTHTWESQRERCLWDSPHCLLEWDLCPLRSQVSFSPLRHFLPHDPPRTFFLVCGSMRTSESPYRHVNIDVNLEHFWGFFFCLDAPCFDSYPWGLPWRWHYHPRWIMRGNSAPSATVSVCFCRVASAVSYSLQPYGL